MNRTKLFGLLLVVIATSLHLAAVVPAQQNGKAAGGNARNDPAADGESKTAAVIYLEDVIDPALEQFIHRKMERAKSRGVDYVVIYIDSPGGYADTSFNLADYFVSVKWATVVAYIPREALSGAAIAALGCEEIVLGKNARFGDAGAIQQTSFGGAFRYVPEKLLSNFTQHMRVIARAHDRPEALAEAMMDSKLKVYKYRHVATGEEKYFSSREINNLDEDEWQRVSEVPESGDERFLEVTGERAVELGLATEVATDLEQLLAARNVHEPPAVYRPGTIEAIVGVLNNPFVTGLLFVAGLVALYFELSAPGIGIGGMIAALCFGLFFWSRFLGGTSGWLEVLLFGVGVAFLLLEVFVIPGFGVAGFAGLGLIVVSLILASQEFIVPRTPSDRERLAVSLTVIVASGFIFLSCAIMITRHFGRMPVLSRLVLAPPVAAPEDAGAAKPTKLELWQAQVSIGDLGVAESSLRPAGKAMFGEAYVDVVADGAFVDAGRTVRVVEISGNRVVVREVEKPKKA